MCGHKPFGNGILLCVSSDAAKAATEDTLLSVIFYVLNHTIYFAID